MIPQQRQITALIRWVYVLFFISGALGLVYQVLWLRKLLLVFGSTVHAVSTVLTVFFAGLALGSWLLGRLIDRHNTAGLLWYAACEAAIGAYAFVTPWLFSVIERVYIPLYQASGFSPSVLVGASLLCSALILIIPTTLMGGTFPIMSRFLIRTMEERGVKIASLYGINTLGAMTGTLFVYYIGLQRLGWLVTLQCAGLVNLLIGVLGRTLARNLKLAGFHAAAPSASQVESPGQPTPPKQPLRLRRPETRGSTSSSLDSASSRSGFHQQGLGVLMAAFGLSGAAAMIYEVAWTRSLSLVLGSSIYAFCIMLATFLAGIALGSFVARRTLGLRGATLSQFMLIEVALAGYGLFSITMFGWLPDWFVSLWPLFGGSFAGWSWVQLVLSAAVMALPTFLMGLLFPLVGDLVTGRFAQLGERLGLAYAVNTLGGIVGSFACGFWLIPGLGIAWALVIAAIANLLAALMIYIRFEPVGLPRRLALSSACFAFYLALGAWVFVPSWKRQVLSSGAYLDPARYRDVTVSEVAGRDKLLFYRESFNATVSVHQSPRHLYLKVGGKTDASTGVDMGTQVLAAHLPLLIHHNPKQMLLIGLGSGITLGSAGRYPVSVLHCAELDPAVVEAARYFAQHNYQIHDDPRTTIYVADGRNFLLASRTAYDVIVSEPSNPWMAGVGYLFTEEFYRLAKKRLAPGGIMAQWVQLYRIFPSDVKLLLKTFQAVFPHVSVWSTIPGDLLLIGSQEPHQLDFAHVQQQLQVPAIRSDLERLSITHPLALLEFFQLDSEQVRTVTADVGWTHRDDLPWLEFHAPKAMYYDGTFRLNYEGIRRFQVPASAIAPDAAAQPKDAAFYVAVGLARIARKEITEAVDALEESVRLNPTQASGYLRLGQLYAQRGWSLKAEEALSKATQLDPDHQEAHQSLARVLWAQAKREEALASFLRAARLKPPDRAFAEELGGVLREMKRWREASECYRSSLSQYTEPDGRALVFLALGQAFKELREWPDAQQLLRAARQHHPDDVSLTILLAQIALEQDRSNEAKALFEDALARAPRPPPAAAHFGLGQIAFNEGNFKIARRHLLQGLRYDAYNKEALETLRTMTIQRETVNDGSTDG